MPEPLLEPKLLRKLEQFQLRTGRRARSSARGERRSKAHGQSVEFADYRNYVAGDDLRYLDWNLYGRLDRFFLKLYEEERELSVTLFLDASESMTFGEPSKFSFAQKIAGAIGYVSLCGFDRVTLTALPDTAVTPALRSGLRSVRGRKSSLGFLQALSQLAAGGTMTFNAALRRAALETRQPGVAVVLSDFLDPAGYETGLHALAGRGFRIHALQVLSPEELAPAHAGDLRLVDSETGAEQEVTFGRYRLKAYQRSTQNYIQRLREFCRARGISFLSVSSGAPMEALLLREFRETGLWG
ncbi:MAG: DUF58 domain-containing protein [Verrucomicrobia bacterium]|nr:DUF58 domain-containing protein [Verrucomicrobiota bacterium]